MKSVNPYISAIVHRQYIYGKNNSLLIPVNNCAYIVEKKSNVVQLIEGNHYGIYTHLYSIILPWTQTPIPNFNSF